MTVPSFSSWLAPLSLLAVGLVGCGGQVDPNDSLGQPVVAGVAGAGQGDAGRGGAGAGPGSSGQGGAASVDPAGQAGAAGVAPQPAVACWSAQYPAGATPAGYAPPLAIIEGCSLPGTWDIFAEGNSYPSLPKSISFDAQGRFVAGPQGADLCAGFVRSGVYTAYTFGAETPAGGLAGMTLLKIASLGGSDLLGCEQGGEAAYAVAPLGDCDHLMLDVRLDSCTGAGIFRDGGKLVRRP